MDENKNLKWYYSDIGRETTLAMDTLHTTQYWAIGLISLLLGATIFLGDFPDKRTIIVLLFALVLTFIFFKRSLLACINLYRWNTIQKKIFEIEVLTEKDNLEQKREDLFDYVQLHHHQFWSPFSRNYMIKTTLLLGYLPLFAIQIALIGWAYFSFSWDLELYLVLGFALGYLIYDFHYILVDRLYNRKNSQRGTIYQILFQNDWAIPLFISFIIISLLVLNSQQELPLIGSFPSDLVNASVALLLVQIAFSLTKEHHSEGSLIIRWTVVFVLMLLILISNAEDTLKIAFSILFFSGIFIFFLPTIIRLEKKKYN